ncbi:hypothetical protein L207DRAFT_534418 [Hyaloscypha variabilis F]|uniref:Uncharacterized protein n=1 Tax=Hyaloscypha variabilis (strain UAMH 11265 / GT02V1 / F) TaxID=1149755 RepID=A0A2J6R6A8_HYAVF|nr:hypothetical protein L207DRAFT_534418 [Hyaloscypha variabilis F]
MGEFHDAVSTLLEAFGRGIDIIKCQRGTREKEQLPIEPAKKSAETHLSKSLKKNRVDVKNAYGRDLARHGPGFAVGDAEAHSSLSAILFRLNAGFVSVIERFTRGRSTSTDYQALLNLSNASRMEAINTFEQLSQRLSHSSMALVSSGTNETHAKHRTHQRRKKASSSAGHAKHSRSKSAPDLSLTAKKGGWVRPKAGRKPSSDSKSSATSGSSTPRLSSPKTHSSQPSRATERTSPPSSTRVVPQLRGTKMDNRNSIRSFATDSTKLGEIPEHKWARPSKLDTGQFSVRRYYPLEPYQEPEKQKSRFMRFFRRGVD